MGFICSGGHDAENCEEKFDELVQFKLLADADEKGNANSWGVAKITWSALETAPWYNKSYQRIMSDHANVLVFYQEVAEFTKVLKAYIATPVQDAVVNSASEVWRIMSRIFEAFPKWVVDKCESNEAALSDLAQLATSSVVLFGNAVLAKVLDPVVLEEAIMLVKAAADALPETIAIRTMHVKLRN